MYIYIYTKIQQIISKNVISLFQIYLIHQEINYLKKKLFIVINNKSIMSSKMSSWFDL